MADFREKINRLQNENTKAELIDALAERLDERTTSVNPITEAIFSELRPGTMPVEYARKSEYYSQSMSPVAVSATALKILLHEQVGRPLYEPVGRPKKQDFAECITAVDAFHEGIEQEMGVHTPTTLPLDIEEFVENPPDRSQTPDSPFDIIADLGPLSETQDAELEFNIAESPYFVYVLDCTPPIDNEPDKIWDRRRAVQTKIESGIPVSELEPKEQATHALNQSKRVYYVGSTADINDRVEEHLSGTDKSGVNFTNTLSPRALVKVESCDTRKHAETLEGALAKELTGKERLFAYSDEK